MAHDLIIVGSGIAGLYTALLAQRFGRVLILTKSSIEDCNTAHAQGGIAVAMAAGDSPELHLGDTLAAGAGLSDERAARVLTEEALDCVHDLIEFAVPFDTTGGEIALGQEAAHSRPRILHAGGDATGANIELTLSALATRERIEIWEHHYVTEIVVEGGKVCAVRTLDSATGRLKEVEGRSYVLATGGAGQLFQFNTNPEIATGDGVALAYKAGAEVMDLEFYQFHPTVLNLPGVPRFLISEAVRGEGGILRNSSGQRFMPDYHPQAELAARDIVARAILVEMQKDGGSSVFLDVRHLPARRIVARFPTIYRFCLEHGLDITKELIPVAPAAHYMMGGIRTNIWGESSIQGLFACGEVGCTGVHGANRLASNSLLEALVFGRRVVLRSFRAKEERADSEPSTQKFVCFSLGEVSLAPAVPPPSREALGKLMWDKVGMVRAGEGLEEARRTLASWERMLSEPHDRASYELANMVLTSRLMAEAALLRKESRGAHYRLDFPRERKAWRKHIVFRRE